MAVLQSRAALEGLLRKMAELIQSDAALLSASKGRRLTIGFEFPDHDVCFYTNFLDGRMEAGLGEPEVTDLQLTMDSDVFDGMFTGKVKPAKAAIKGDLAFSGKVASAMRLQGLLGDFQRLYLQAKQTAAS